MKCGFSYVFLLYFILTNNFKTAISDFKTICFQDVATIHWWIDIKFYDIIINFFFVINVTINSFIDKK